MNENELETEEVELVSLEELRELESLIDQEYAEVEVDDFDESVEEIEVDGLQLWNRTKNRSESMSLDRETLMDLYGDSEYDTY